MGEKKVVFSDPKHPYTNALLSAVPVPDPNVKRKRVMLKGEVPSPINPPPGCRFHTRCPLATDICMKEEPKLVEIDNNHFVACHMVK